MYKLLIYNISGFYVKGKLLPTFFKPLHRSGLNQQNSGIKVTPGLHTDNTLGNHTKQHHYLQALRVPAAAEWHQLAKLTINWCSTHEITIKCWIGWIFSMVRRNSWKNASLAHIKWDHMLSYFTVYVLSKILFHKIERILAFYRDSSGILNKLPLASKLGDYNCYFVQNWDVLKVVISINSEVLVLISTLGFSAIM